MKKIALRAALLAMTWIAADVSRAKTSDEDTLELENMVVTAQKRQENASDVPISMDVFSGDTMEMAGMDKIPDLVNFSSNVSMLERSCEHIVVIRGVSPFRGCTYSPAGLYVDDVSYPLHYMQNFDLFDIERAEILKGPQSTLYGSNSESGVIKIVTRQPGPDFEGRMIWEYAEYDTFKTSVSLTTPVVENTLFIGGAFQYKATDGYLENLSDGDDKAADQDHLAGRFTLRWTPQDAWDISLTVDGADHEDHGATGRALTGTYSTPMNKIRSDCDSYLNQSWSGQSLRVTYGGQGFTVLSVSAIQDQHLDKVNDCDLWDDPSNEKINPLVLDTTRYSQELRITSDTGGPFEWLGGVFAFHEDSSFDYRYEIVSSNMVYMNPKTDVETDGAAIFGQGRVRLADRLHTTVGLRLDYQTSEGDLTDSVQGKAYSDTIDDYEFLPKGVLDYDVADNIMAYLSVARGYMPGGFDWGNTATKQTFAYDPEYTLNYEAGMKSTWFDNRLLVNLSAFYIKMDDKQVSEMHPTLAVVNISNAAEAHSTGVELSAEARPVKGLSLLAGFGFNKSEFDEFNATVSQNNTLVQKDYSGNDLPYAPRYTFNLGMQYRASSGFYGRLDYLGTGEFYGDAANKAKQEGYEIVNLRLGYQWKKLDISVWGENLFDEEYQTFVTPFSNTIVGNDGPPRCFGVTLAVRL